MEKSLVLKDMYLIMIILTLRTQSYNVYTKLGLIYYMY